MSKYKFTFRDHGHLIGGSVDLDPKEEHKPDFPFIDVYGHYCTTDRTKEVARKIQSLMNEDTTAWEYFKLGFKKLYETWVEERLEILSK